MKPGDPRPLNIIQVFNRYLYPGGEEKSVARIARDLEEGGHRVARFWRTSEEWQGPGAPRKWRQPGLLWKNAAVLEDLARLQQSTRADLWVLHNVVPVISLGVYELARRLGVPVIQWLHNYRPISPSGTLLAGRVRLEPEDRRIAWKETRAGSWRGPLLTAWLALGYARIKRRGDFEAVRAWVAISEEMRGIFARAGWHTDRLHTLRHCWHRQCDQPDRRDDAYFLFLGRLVEPKGARFLVDLWRSPALRQSTLVMAGQGELADELRAQSPANVRWAGHVEGEEKENLLAGCRAVLFPSIWEEPLGIVAYEAYDYGKPVLASNVGGIREVVQNGRSGRLLEPAAAAAWSEAILALDAATARQMGMAGTQWLEENASPARWNEGFAAIAQQAIGTA